jgi:hypothetical protein
METNHPCKIECQRRVHKGYANCVDEGQCDYAKLPERSLADEIPEWFEGGTCQQMLDEAFAQIRRLETMLAAAPSPSGNSREGG